MYENKKEPLASSKTYYRRIGRNFLFVSIFMSISLGIGILGYHYLANIPWLDALHNASMILSGMGPVAEVKTVAGKWFSSAYAIFSGVAFITNIGYLLAPAVHRFFHRLHLED